MIFRNYYKQKNKKTVLFAYIKKIAGLIIFICAMIMITRLGYTDENTAAQKHSFDLTRLIEYIKKNNMDILNSLDNLKYTKYLIDETKSLSRPVVNFESNFTRLKDESYENKNFTNNFNYKFSLAQPLFTYGKIESAIKISEHYYRSSEKDYELTVKNVTLAAAKLLYAVKLLEYQREIYQASENTFLEHFNNVKAKFEADDATKVDYLNAMVNYEQIKPKIIDIDNKITTIKNELKILLNIDLSAELITTEDIIVSTQEDKKYNPKDIFEKSIKTNEAFQKMNEQLEILKLQRKMSQNTLRPSVSLITTLGANAKNAEDLFGSAKNNAMAGINLTFPLFDGFKAKNQVREFETQIKMLERNIVSFKNNLLKNIETLTNSLKQIAKQIAADQYVCEQAEEAARVTLENFRAGSSVNLDVIESEKNKLNAKISLISDKYNFIINSLDLKNAAGVVLNEK